MHPGRPRNFLRATTTSSNCTHKNKSMFVSRKLCSGGLRLLETNAY